MDVRGRGLKLLDTMWAVLLARSLLHGLSVHIGKINPRG